MNKGFFAGKKVLVMGLGRFGGGVDSVRFACGAGAKVIVTDLAETENLRSSIDGLKDFPQIEYHLGSHKKTDFEKADIIIANPAVPLDNEYLQIARSNKKIVTSQINIFFELCRASIIGITGSAGKSTTASLTAHLLKSAKERKVWLGGNIGNTPLLTVLDEIKSDDLVVLELSSFQLEQLADIKKAPKLALLTNLTPNHLDRHKTFADYCDAKENIFRYQNLDENNAAVSIFNAEDKIAAEWFEKYNGQSGRICRKFFADDIGEEIRSNFNLPGRANLSNLAAAVTIARHFGISDEEIKESLSTFKPLPHRLELAAEKDGVRWYNDSKATTPESAIVAIDSFDEQVILIAGGYDKNISFGKLGEKIANRCKAVILLGQTAQKIAEAIKEHKSDSCDVQIVDSLPEAVESAKDFAVSGDVVLLSPACASYDMFDNFEHRGLEFTKLVQKI